MALKNISSQTADALIDCLEDTKLEGHYNKLLKRFDVKDEESRYIRLLISGDEFALGTSGSTVFNDMDIAQFQQETAERIKIWKDLNEILEGK